MGSSVPYNTQQQQQQQQRQRQQEQKQRLQDTSAAWQSPSSQDPTYPSSSSSSSSYWSQRSSSINTSAAQQPNQVLSSAIDKLYKQRLREVKALLASGQLEQLQQELSPEQQESLEIILQDLQVCV
jgi:hypothetical protein